MADFYGRRSYPHFELERGQGFRILRRCVKYYYYSSQGFLAKLDSGIKCFKFMFTVYDGHGGAKIAAHVSKNLHKFIVRRPEYKQGNYEDAIVKVWNLAIPSYLTYFKVKRFFRPSWSVTRQRERTSL